MHGAFPLATKPLASASAWAGATALAWERIILLSPTDSDEATLAAGSPLAALPVTNLQAQDPKKVYRSTSTTDYITAAFAEPLAINMVAMNAHQFSSMAVWRVRLANSLAATTSAPAIDSGWQSVWPTTGKPVLRNWRHLISAMRWTNNSQYGYARVDFIDPDTTRTYNQIGRLALGRYWQPSADVDFGGLPLGWAPRDVQTETDYAELFTDRRNLSAPRRFQFMISAGDRDEIVNGLDEIQRLRGLWGDVFVFQNINAGVDFQKLSMQGVFTAPGEHQIVPQFNDNGALWTAPLAFREV